MTDLILSPNLENADGFYADLVAAHDGLVKADSDALNARLVLVLANHIGNANVLSSALKAATLKET
ncbi:DUF2783 domain-containing protein [Ruegeria atlantica]|uniref:DUF2783 domain-containing protein n=1 Tax=Ruegeria atlantica TaxID=81569 RepID=UPI0024945978|nr:DUF2783 domain-containing protein [Ruegeria atlantica]